MKAHSLAKLQDDQGRAGRPYLEFLRTESLSAGLYVLPAGAMDPQRPHNEDEVYVVVRGRARFSAATETRAVGPHDVLFVPAGVDHRFHDITEELALYVVFAPPES